MTLPAWLRSILPGGSARQPSATALPWSRVREVFDSVLERPAAERRAFLTGVCQGDARLLAEVTQLLAAHEESSLIDRPLDAIVGPLFAADDTPTMEVAQPKVVSHYELLDLIPGGGMGVLYRARDRQLQRIVALKFLPASLGSDARAKERFLLEARAAAALDHRNVCTIHEIGESEDGQLFIAMPFYAGETVADLIARGPLPVSQAVSIAGQIARGLAHAHGRGSIHRDIKPANVMVTPDGVVKILDFGIVKQHGGASFTRTGGALGTLPYMSPERLHGEPADPRTDIWSLGVVLYEMLAGRRPFDARDEHVLREAISFAPPPSLKSIRPELPTELSRLVNNALAKHADDRPASADAVADVLDALSVTEADGAALADRAARDRPETDTSQVLPGGERRHATVVVSRLSGHGELVERCSPHEVDQVIRRLKGEAWEIVERHGGTINEFGEERIVLLFGVPLSVEDHCARAVRAAVELRALLAQWRDSRPAAGSLALHAAIDTGEAAVQPMDGALVPYRIAGRPARRAAQLCAHARTDEILLSPEGQRAVSTQFHMVTTAPVSLADDSASFTPTNVMKERDEADRLDQMAGGSTLTAFTGREAELAALVRAFEDARGGHGRFVTVTGEAGVGKSRLLLEFRRTVDPASVTILVGRCSSYGQATAFAPFLQAMRQLLRLDGGETAGTEAGVVERVATFGVGLEAFLPYYLRLLSIPSDSYRVRPERDEQMRLVISEALVALLLAAAAGRPLVLLLEDWHWVDPASDETLRRLVDMIGGHRLLVVTTTRSAISAWQRRDEHLPVTLRAFAPSLTAAMVRALLAVDEVPGPLAAHLHERTGGNPFFLEETVRSLTERETVRVDAGRIVLAGALGTLQIPTTVQAVIRMRLDRLNLEARQAVRVASVVGRDFTYAILVRLLEDSARVTRAVTTLVEAGIIRQTALVPEPAYTFRHALTQEAAYAGLLEHQRADLHANVGRAIEELYGEQLGEHLDRLAQHFSLAEDWPKAVQYGLRSADRIRDLMQVLEALRLLDRTREWAAMLDETERRTTVIEILFRQVPLCDTLGERERHRRTAEELVTLLESDGNTTRLAEACRYKGDLHTVMHEFDEAEAWLDRSLRICREQADSMGERAALRSLGFLRWTQERYQDALGCGEAALDIDRRQNRVTAIAGELHNLATVHTILGQIDRARSCLEEALAVSEPARDRNPAALDLWESRISILHAYGCLLARQGEPERALEYLGPDAEWSRDDNPLRVAHFFAAAAHVHLLRGRVDDCLAAYERSIGASRLAHLAPQLAESLEPFAETLIALGRQREALDPLEEAARVFRGLANRRGEARMWARIAQIHERLGNIPEARAGWECALSLQRDVNNPQGEVEALEGLGRVARRHLPASVALRFYEDAIARCAATGDEQTVARLHNSAGIIEWTRANHGGALHHFEQALALFQARGDDAGSGQMLNSVGVSLRALGRRDEARGQLERAIAHHVRTGQTQLEGHALGALGDLEWDSGDSIHASALYERSLQKRREVGDVRGEGWMLQRLARAHVARGHADDAEALLARAGELAARCSDEELMNACAQLGAVAPLRGQNRGVASS